MLKSKREYLQNAKRQRFWASLALRDSRYAEKQARRLERRHDKVSAMDFEREARIGRLWAHKRLCWAKQYEKRASKLR